MPLGISQEIKLQKGESITLSLKGLSMAGYAWNFTIDGNEDCIKVSKKIVPLKKSAQKKMGASANEVFTITAQKEGMVIIHFFQHRSWEQKAAHADEKKVKIIIE